MYLYMTLLSTQEICLLSSILMQWCYSLLSCEQLTTHCLQCYRKILKALRFQFNKVFNQDQSAPDCNWSLYCYSLLMEHIFAIPLHQNSGLDGNNCFFTTSTICVLFHFLTKRSSQRQFSKKNKHINFGQCRVLRTQVLILHEKVTMMNIPATK